jgi:GT2 family glycosyltransferase
MIDRKDVVIIIPHFGASPESEFAFENHLQTLNETEPTIKKIVVKNGSKCRHNGTIRFMSAQDQGQCRAVNAAVAATNEPWIMVTNDDMMYAPGWFERLTFYANDLRCVSPKLIEPIDGAPTFEKFFAGGAGGDFDKAKWLQFNKEHQERPLQVFRTGFNLPFLIRRDVWELVGGYDINYDPWGSNSDSDLEYKLKLSGIQPMQDPNAIVYHFSQTSGTFEPRNRPSWEKNWQYFIDKWGFQRTDNGIWEASFDIPNEGRKFRPWWEGFYNK